MSRKAANSSQDAPPSCQKHVRKADQPGAGKRDEKRLLINLSHLVISMSSAGNVAAYQEIADQMSAIAGLNGNSWTWRYVASVNSGTMEPGRKFLRVLDLLLEEIQPRAKQWFYFARYHSVAAVFDKSMKREMIIDHMLQLGYKPVSFTRWTELKTAAVRSGRA